VVSVIFRALCRLLFIVINFLHAVISTLLWLPIFTVSRLASHTHTHLSALCPGLPRWAGIRKVKPIWILLKQETVSGSGIHWAICKSTPHSRQITTPAPHHLVSYRPDALPAAQPTASRHWRHAVWPQLTSFFLFCKRTFTISSTCASCRLDISLKAHQSVGKNYWAIIVSCLHIIIMSLLHNISRQYIVNYTCFLTVISFSQLILINVIYFGFHWTSCCFVCMF